MMIDDHMAVLSKLDESIFKIWFCDDVKKIEAVRKCQPRDFSCVHLARNWKEVEILIRSYF